MGIKDQQFKPKGNPAHSERKPRGNQDSGHRTGSGGVHVAGYAGATSPNEADAQGVIGSGGLYESFATGSRRQGRYQQQVIRLPDQLQGQVRRVYRRLPTPEPDNIERIYVQRTAGEVVEEITEIPMTPPPRVREQTVVEPSGPPQVVRRTVRVPPRSGGYGGYQQGGSFASQGGQVGGSYGSVGGDYGAFDGGYAPASGSYGSVGGGYSPQPAAPQISISGAYCFYV